MELLPEVANAEPTGYSTHDTYFATRYTQGDRVFYSVDLSLPELIALVPAPDPDKPPTENRRITPGHAKKFAEYVLTREDWVCPPMLLRVAHGEFEFESIKKIGGTDLGLLAIPKLARHSLHITDGQHRVLGFHWAWEKLDADIEKAREHLARAKRADDPALVAGADRNLKRLIKLRERLAAQRIGLDMIVVDDPAKYHQVFVDIADNALGISRAVSVRFDRRKVVNRALETVMTHPLLVGRVDEQSDRIAKTSPFLMGAKHVTDLTRQAQVGKGRISRKQEADLSEIVVAGNACRFLDAVVAAFPDLEKVQAGELSPEDLRGRSLLGSATMLRVLAAVYGELVVRTDDDGSSKMTQDDYVEFLKTLDGDLGVPITETSRWMSTGVFVEGASAPSARQGDVGKFTSLLIDEALAWRSR